MNQWRILYHLARADFFERSRRYSFLVTLLVIIAIVYAYLLPADTGGVTFNLGGHRGIYNSAWVGAIVSVLCSALLTLPGFFLIKNTIERDTNTRVGQVLATTPISRMQYILGKLFSNFVFLAVMVGVIMAAALVMQLVRAEFLQIDLWHFVAPFLFTTLPVMALIAALAILFETIPWLRGGFGNIVYLFFYVVIVMVSIMPSQVGSVYRMLPEPFGLTVIAADMSQDVKAVYSDYNGGLVIGYTPLRGEIQTFVWDGVEWDLSIVLMRMLWVVIALAIALLASLLFHRFDPALENQRSKKKRQKTGLPDADDDLQPDITPAPTQRPITELTPVTRREANSTSLLFRTLFAEIKLMLKGLPWWWYVVALAIVLFGLFGQDREAWVYALLAAWIWPILIWSGMGCREKRHHASEIIFSAAHTLARQMPAAWLAGLLVALLLSSGAAMRMLTAGKWSNLLALAAGAAFIPALALAFGVWSGGSKLFEVTYLAIWYIGPLNGLPALDFMGLSTESLESGVWLYYLAAAVLLFGLAIVGRIRQMSQ